MGRKLKGKSSRKGQLQTALAKHQTQESLKKKVVKRNEAITSKSESVKKSENKNNQNKTAQIHSVIPFTPKNKILLVGEGDFSFALSILREGYIKPENLIITSFDNSVNELQLKYPSSFAKNYEEIVNTYKAVKVFFKVDGTQLSKSLRINNKQKFLKTLGLTYLDFIIFNFPHTGKGMKDQDRNIRDHQLLVLGFLKSCQELFKIVEQPNKRIAELNILSEQREEPKIILSVFEGEPYDSWNIKMLSKSLGLSVARSSAFDWDSFPDYHHRRTNSEKTTTKEASERKARLYVFEKYKKDVNKKNKNDDDEGSDRE
jgi:25S rRNA (uracil2634-N3)-methyltransferase